MKLFIQGKPGIGKSAILQNIVTRLRESGFKVGGVSCPEIRDDRSRVGFEIIDLLDGRRGILSHTYRASGPSVGKYRINLRDLSRIGVPSLEKGISKADVVIIDEIGPMEIQSTDFQDAIVKTIESSKPVLGIIHWRLKHPIIDRILRSSDVKIFHVSSQNREMTQTRLIKALLNALGTKRS